MLDGVSRKMLALKRLTKKDQNRPFVSKNKSKLAEPFIQNERR